MRNRVAVSRRPVWSLPAAQVVFAGAATGTAQAGYHNATAWAISDTGVVVGNWLTPDNQFHAFRWDPDGRATDLARCRGRAGAWPRTSPATSTRLTVLLDDDRGAAVDGVDAQGTAVGTRPTAGDGPAPERRA